MLGRNVPTITKSPMFSNDVMQLFVNQNHIIANLEAPFFHSSVKKGFGHKQSDTKLMSFVSAVSIANNHIFDQGNEGYEYTKRTLVEANIPFFGTKKEPYYNLDTDSGQKMLIVGCIDFNIVSGQSEDNKELFRNNILKLSDKKEIAKIIEKFRDHKKVLYVHAGDEFIPIIKSDLNASLNYYAGIGFDYIMITHPHVVGGQVTLNKKTKVFYSLGDFIFDGDSYLRMHSYGVSIKMNNNVITEDTLVFFRRENKRVFIRLNNTRSAQIRFSIHSLFNKNIFGGMYFLLFWMYMISYQTNRIVFSLRYSGIKATIISTIRRASFLKHYLK